MEVDSVDISQLKARVLDESPFETKVASTQIAYKPSNASPSNHSRSITRHVPLKDPQTTGEPRPSDGTNPSNNSSHVGSTAFGTAKTRMSNGTQQSGRTEPISQWVYETDPKATGSGRQDSRKRSSQEDFETGQAGFVAFGELSQFADDGLQEEQPELEVEAMENNTIDDTRMMPPGHSAGSGSIGQPPETPAASGKKRDYNGNAIEHQFTTPRLPPQNPFANNQGADRGVVSLTQAFNLTQAQSSPLVNDVTSDAVSNKPTPGMQYGNRPSTAGPSSSPAKMQRYSLQRSATEPYTKWKTTQEDEVTAEKISSPLAQYDRNSPNTDDEILCDVFDSSNARLLKEKQRHQKPKRQLSRVNKSTGRSLSGSNRTQKLGSRLSGNKFSATPGKLREHVRVSEDSDSGESDRETEHEGTNARNELEEQDEAVEDDKENTISRQARGPRAQTKSPTVIRAARNVSHSSPIRPRVRRPRTTDSSSSDELGSLRSSQRVSKKSRDSKPRSSEVQPMIVDSQESPSQRRSRAGKRTAAGTRDPISSDKIIQESQPYKVPNTSQLDSSIARKELGTTSSQARGPSHAEDSPQYDNTRRHEDIRETPYNRTSFQKRTADSSKSLTVGDGRVADIAKGADAVDDADEIDDIPIQDRPQLDSPTRPSSYGHSISKKRLAKGSSKTPNSRNGRSASTIPETESIQRFQTLPSNETTATTSDQARDGTTTGEDKYDHSNAITTEALDRYSGSPKRQPEARLPKSMKELAQITESQDDQPDFSIDLLTTEDNDYLTEMAKIDKMSSPVGPKSRRRRQRENRARVANHMSVEDHVPTNDDLPTEYGNMEDLTLTTLSSQERNQILQREVHVANHKHELPEQRSDKENSSPKLPVKGFTSQHQQLVGVPDTSKAIPVSNSRMTAAAVNVIIQPEVDVDHPRSTPPSHSPGGLDNEMNEVEDQPPVEEVAAPAETDAMQDADSDRAPQDISNPNLATNFDETSTTHPNRVFAYFKGAPLGYYPATCVSVRQSHNQYTVRFDDGTESTLLAWQLKRLELREGDPVRIDLKGLRSKQFTVQGLERKPGPEGVPIDQTDMFGNTHVVVVEKTKSGSTDQSSTSTFPVTYIYYTLGMWSAITDRRFAGFAFEKSKDDSDLEKASSLGPSTPSTPKSRQRSAKALMKSSTMHLDSVAAKTSTSIFSGFIFAITGIANADLRKDTEMSILTNGGQLLKSGFEELFVPSSANEASRPSTPKSSTIVTSRPPTPASSSLGNTSPGLTLRPDVDAASPTILLADRHSRNNKFIQALALGMPCLHTRWIRDCCAQHKFLDWRPYLLSSGESKFLAGATVSQWLPHIKDTSNPEDLSLQRIIQRRNRWLEERHVLLVGSGTGNKMEAYLFFALALGAKDVKVVNSMADARKLLQKSKMESESSTSEKCYWDWVCISEEEHGANDGHHAAAKKGRLAKKRKSNRGEAIRPVDLAKGIQGVKIVGTESVVQSLILGRLLEPEELDTL